ncbi:MAG TPA: DUF2085 domain-containing protein [Roseiflexaceae bacterium]|nr:DUF2085 domain-containing protein [Roseiflexaceae bacterium]
MTTDNLPGSSQTDEVLQRARQQIAERKDVQRELHVSAGERPWRIMFLSLLAVLVLGLVLWPGAPLEWKMYAAVHGVCAQVHNVQLGGMQLPLCARNTGIYGSFLLSGLYLLALGRARAGRLPPIAITALLVLFVIVMGVDGVNSMLRDMFLPHLYVPRNDLRTLTGIGTGTALGVALLLILNLALRRDIDDDLRVLKNWRELGGLLGLNLLLWLGIYGNVSLAYWPIAIVAWIGIVAILFCVNLLVIGLLMRFENAVTRFSQLARPGVIALVFTLVELGLMSWGRFALEAQGLIIN